MKSGSVVIALTLDMGVFDGMKVESKAGVDKSSDKCHGSSVPDAALRNFELIREGMNLYSA